MKKLIMGLCCLVFAACDISASPVVEDDKLIKLKEAKIYYNNPAHRIIEPVFYFDLENHLCYMHSSGATQLIDDIICSKLMDKYVK